jgi:hypothetical protein
MVTLVDPRRLDPRTDVVLTDPRQVVGVAGQPDRA